MVTGFLKKSWLDAKQRSEAAQLRCLGYAEHIHLDPPGVDEVNSDLEIARRARFSQRVPEDQTPIFVEASDD